MEGIARTNVDVGVQASIADNRYYLAPDAQNQDRPTLFCRGARGAGFSNTVALVPNIEDLQVRYALTRATPVDDQAVLAGGDTLVLSGQAPALALAEEKLLSG